MRKRLQNLIKEALKSLNLGSVDFVVEHPTDLKFGDYSFHLKGKDHLLHQDIVVHLNSNKPSYVEKVMGAGGGFINFYLSKEFFKESLGEIIEKGDEFGTNENLKGQKFFIEHTQPNLFKKFHIGHLMNNVIGESLVRIVKANGAEVRTATYHGNKGLHVAKAIWSLLHKPGSADSAYAEGHKAYETDESAKKEIIEINKKIYDESDSRINTLYTAISKDDLAHFESIYQRLDSHFDEHFLESESGEAGKKIVLANLGKIFEESEGAVVFRGEKFGLHTRVFLNSERLPTYEAKEVGLAEMKKDLFPYDISITITASEQDAFFNVVEVAIGEIFPELKGKLKHISHGMLRLPTGKMSSRTGDVITAEELIDEIKKRVKDSEPVAIGAIKYMILRQAIGNDIIFDIDKSVSTEGDSGIYLQYAYARTNSLLEKAD
ncbi:MAG: arginine--tRNA ligase, partial [bacterium]|nr:arginine--tRNA ligase [bacterium]